MRRAIVFVACAVVTAALAAPAQAGPSSSKTQGQTTEYVVLYKDGVSLEKAHSAVKAAGGTIVKENAAVGVATVRSSSTAFAVDARKQSAVDGVARNRAVGEAPKLARAAVNKSQAVEKEGRHGSRGSTSSHKPSAEPLANLQWDMKQIHATAGGSYKKEPGDHRVLVGVIDTGIDGTHPDIAPNFNRALSRNFTTDIPVDANGTEVDGPCEHPSCVDPVDEDDNEHGTHVASTIGAPLNGLGIAGVAPDVSLVNVRAGQDSGYFFLQPVVDALTYSGDHGIDVVNMSFYTDPWLFNCTNNPADSPENQAEQRTVIQASERALAYAHRHGVTLVSAAGNGATDYTKTITDASSPDYPSVPGEAPYSRTIPPSCVSEPSEGQNVIAVSALGISTRKSYYSDYGNGYVAVSAPGGDSYDTADNKADVTHAILAAYPKSLAVARGELNPDGTPNVPYVVRSCKGSTCGYYQYLQGTSMASPHATGVVALIVSRYGSRDRVHGGLTLSPARAQSILEGTATEHACPTPRAFTYTRQVLQSDGTYLTVTTTHTCEGSKSSNGFYGHGIIDALGAVSH
ncbi:S8 family serine peptidase [Actinoallomurus bryophytorum]|uniref:Subtilase family protein n=1 Tax=Actinoallomurus bryophytorum TaxID=1490222 RepID=A0A543CJA7_9ACTN|nr:S8 family serine peptidase [Actinoallomurus bryophytorum]TQL96987.1 subtilase family protein [Actinoallomurus bryophytorum]